MRELSCQHKGIGYGSNEQTKGILCADAAFDAGEDVTTSALRSADARSGRWRAEPREVILGQYRPASASVEQYRRDRQALYAALAGDGLRLTWPINLNPYPLLIDDRAIGYLDILCDAITIGLHQIVVHYHRDKRIRALFELDPELDGALTSREGLPYAIGAFRLDFLIDEWGHLWVCGIHARFDTHEPVVSQLVNAAIDEVSYLSGVRSVPARVLAEGRYHNELRTLALVHHERMLAALSDRHIMRDYLSVEHCDWLARHIAPTFTARDVRARTAALEDPRGWVLRLNHEAHGARVHIGRETQAERWEALIDGGEHCRYTLQRFIEQRCFPIRHLHKGQLRETTMSVVGQLPCLDDLRFGPGIFLASASEVGQVRGQHQEVLPCGLVSML